MRGPSPNLFFCFSAARYAIWNSPARSLHAAEKQKTKNEVVVAGAINSPPLRDFGDRPRHADLEKFWVMTSASAGGAGGPSRTECLIPHPAETGCYESASDLDHTPVEMRPSWSAPARTSGCFPELLEKGKPVIAKL